MIRKVSIPLIVGMIVAAGVGPSEALATFSLAISAVILAYSVLRRDVRPVCLVLLFLSLGAFCYSSCAISALIAAPAPFSASAITKAIGSVPYRRSETAALLQALMTGQREGLPDATVKAFRDSGASHILALSGLHLGIIYILISKPMALLGNSPAAYRVRCLSTVAVSGVYVLATGAGASLIRAFLFIFLNEVSKLHPERKRDGLLIFWTALTIQATLNPLSIRSVGFQLSYLAVFGILTIYPSLKNFYPKTASKLDVMHRIWDSMALSLSCQIFTAPLAFLHFGTFPKYFLLTNLIALPLTEILIAGGVLCSLLTLAGICPPVLVNAIEGIALTLEESLKAIAGM